MEQLLGQMRGGLFGVFTYFLTYGILVWLAFAYVHSFWAKRGAESASQDDTQTGLKLAIYAMLIVSVGIAAGGLNAVLHYLLAGAKATPILKAGLGSMIAGGGMFCLLFFMFLPRTNTKDYPQAERYAVGYVALIGGLITVFAVEGLLSGLFGGADWKTQNAAAFSNLVVYGGLTFVTLFRFGSMSGWTAPARAPAMPAFQPQQQMQQPQQGYQQPQQGYPPQGGVPPAGGGYPPQGGVPPAGGGYPPQGGGGGLPPPGGGYPPR